MCRLGFGLVTQIVSAKFRCPPLTPVIASDSGAFWFLTSNNLELLVKVLDGRAFNEKFWVFIESASGLEYTVTTDRATGVVKTYFNPAGAYTSPADTPAF